MSETPRVPTPGRRDESGGPVSVIGLIARVRDALVDPTGTEEIRARLELLKAAERQIMDQLALERAISRGTDPERTPLIRPEDRPECHLEWLLSQIHDVLAEAEEISQDQPKNRQNS